MTTNSYKNHSGIVNHCNTCYINTALQCLRHCPSIISSLVDSNDQDTIILEAIKKYSNNDNQMIQSIINGEAGNCIECDTRISPRLVKVNNGKCNNCKKKSDTDNTESASSVNNESEKNNILDKIIEEYSIDDKKIKYLQVYFQFKKLMYDLTSKEQTLTAKDFIISCCILSRTIGLDYLLDGTQNDMQEYVSFLLDSIHESKAVQTNMTITTGKHIKNLEEKVKIEGYQTYIKHFKNKYSFIIRDFYYLLLGIIKCNKCEYVTFSYDPTCLLSIPIPKNNDNCNISIYDCLDFYFGKEIFNANNIWKCDKCSNQQNNYKEYRVITSPKTLIVAIKRFEFNGSNFRKNSTMVDFPLELNISAYKIEKNQECKYRLFAIGNHIGSLDGGHYYAFCRDISNDENKWICFNDHNISEISENKLVSNTAYMLFYQRID